MEKEGRLCVNVVCVPATGSEIGEERPAGVEIGGGEGALLMEQICVSCEGNPKLSKKKWGK